DGASPTVATLTDVDAVLASVGDTEAAYDAALRNPSDPSLLAAVEAATMPGSPARAEFVEAYWSTIEAGQWAEADPVVPNSVTVLPEGYPTFTADGLSAFVIVCAVSGDSLMG